MPISKILDEFYGRSYKEIKRMLLSCSQKKLAQIHNNYLIQMMEGDSMVFTSIEKMFKAMDHIKLYGKVTFHFYHRAHNFFLITPIEPSVEYSVRSSKIFSGIIPIEKMAKNLKDFQFPFLDDEVKLSM